MKELIWNKTVERGQFGRWVKLVQEWLNLNGFRVKIDSDFGPVTERAVRLFQSLHGLAVDGIVGNNTFTILTRPMAQAVALIKVTPHHTKLGSLVVAYAQQHLAQHPREAGGQNRGPWVRLYMDGIDGDRWAWCAGFATYVLRQACKTLEIAMPVARTFNCDHLANSAKKAKLFIEEGGAAARLAPGALFLVRRTPGDWTHVGIVTQFNGEAFHTIEGNTNDEGHREGYEVCERIRGYKNTDFIMWR